MILTKILENKKKEVEAAKRKLQLAAMAEELAEKKRVGRGFKKHIAQHGRINIIAELKKASPSRGMIRKDYNPEHIAEIYEANGACAVSVLTERKFFKGNISDLEKVRGKISLPVLVSSTSCPAMCPVTRACGCWLAARPFIPWFH